MDLTPEDIAKCALICGLQATCTQLNLNEELVLEHLKNLLAKEHPRFLIEFREEIISSCYIIGIDQTAEYYGVTETTLEELVCDQGYQIELFKWNLNLDFERKREQWSNLMLKLKEDIRENGLNQEKKPFVSQLCRQFISKYGFASQLFTFLGVSPHKLNLWKYSRPKVTPKIECLINGLQEPEEKVQNWAERMIGSGLQLHQYSANNQMQLLRMCEDVGIQQTSFLLSISRSQVQTLFSQLKKLIPIEYEINKKKAINGNQESDMLSFYRQIYYQKPLINAPEQLIKECKPIRQKQGQLSNFEKKRACKLASKINNLYTASYLLGIPAPKLKSWLKRS